eukprot:scaffold54145_cov85-Phaeocystis_antarctica.AAC.1
MSRVGVHSIRPWRQHARFTADHAVGAHVPRIDITLTGARPVLASEEYAATQPFGHSAVIGIDPKSSWRRWRALTETQPAGQSSELAQAFEPGQAARSLQIFSWHAVGTSAGETSVQTAADAPTVPGFSPSQAARESHVVRGAPQTESSAPPQQAAAAAHAIDLTTFDDETASHAAASLAADPRCAAQTVFT